MKNILIINGSHRKNGNTSLITKEIAKIIKNKAKIEEIFLCEKNVEYFNYNDIYSNSDDFNNIKEKMFKADIIIFATPVYWYSMSARLKTFIDRFNTIYISGEMEKLQNKKFALIYSYSSTYNKEEFTFVFKDMSDYLKIEFIGSYSARCNFNVGIRDNDDLKSLETFSNKIINSL